MAKRILQGVIVFFAIYAFVFVPLGKKTAFEHVRAIFGTPAAHEAASEVKGGVTRLVRRLQSEARQSTEDTDRMLDQEDAPLGEVVPPQPAPKQKLRALSLERPTPAQ